MLVAAPAALADTRDDIIRDCNDDGRLDGDYTPSQIRDARKHIPADVDQYSDCRDVLTRALGGTGKSNVGAATGGGSGGGTSGGGSSGGGSAAPATPLTPAGPEDEKAIAGAAADGGTDAVEVGGTPIVPGEGGLCAPTRCPRASSSRCSCSRSSPPRRPAHSSAGVSAVAVPPSPGRRRAGAGRAGGRAPGRAADRRDRRRRRARPRCVRVRRRRRPRPGAHDLRRGRADGARSAPDGRRRSCCRRRAPARCTAGP